MKRFKIILMCAVLCIALFSAFKTRPLVSCTDSAQYFKWGNTYVSIDQYGIVYHCSEQGEICTYYRPDPITSPNTYVPCRLGGFTPD